MSNKVYRLAILANQNTKTPSVVRYSHITAQSYDHIRFLADRIGAVVCGWRAAA